MKKWLPCAALFVVLALIAAPAALARPKVLYVDSYHAGYEWSDGITAGVEKALGDKADLIVHRMDTKRNTSEEFKKQAARKVKALIEAEKPDVVIASDDNASKYVIKEYYYNADLPFVFCGLNWDASEYGFPCKNVTGMVEVTPLPQLLDFLEGFTEGDRIGFLGPDTLTSRKEAENIQKTFDLDLVTYFAKDVDDWKAGFVRLQDTSDIVIVDSDGGLYNEHIAQLRRFTREHTKVPTGACYDFMSPYVLVAFGKVATEQGFWAGRAALEILDGKSPEDIPVAMNQEGTLIINVAIARTLGVEIPYDVLESANKILE